MSATSPQAKLSAIVIGARTRRQGTGPFVAAGLAAAGVEVSAVVGTSESSVAEARRQLADRQGLHPAGYTSIGAALEATRADAVAICSPWQVHREQLLAAAEAGCHCLCEKPLAWPLDEGEADALITAFESRGLLLQVVNQWPTALAAFAELHGRPLDPVNEFTMRLSPISIGPDMITDSAPHFIGMLQALAGAGEVAGANIDAPSAEELQLACRYEHAAGAVEARLVLKTREQRPRPAWFQVNHLRADREVKLPEYRQYLACGQQRVELPDPMGQVTAEFVRDLREGHKTRGDMLRAAHRNLLQLAAAWH